MKALPNLSRTIAALKAYDEADEGFATHSHAMSDEEADAMFQRLEKLGEAVGAAYGLDTADRNDPKTCAALIRPGPRVPPVGSELSFVRRMVALKEKQKR